MARFATVSTVLVLMLAILSPLVVPATSLATSPPHSSTLPVKGTIGGLTEHVVATDSLVLVGEGRSLAFFEQGQPGIIQRAQLPLPGLVSSLAVSGTIAYVGVQLGALSQDAYSGTLHLIDISQPRSPTLLGSYATDTRIRSIALRGTAVSLATTDGVYTLDVVDPRLPVLTHVWHDPSFFAADLTISGARLYASGFNGLRVLDLTNPFQPELLTTLVMTDSYVPAVAVTGTAVYLGGDALTVVDLSALSSPTVVSSTLAHGFINDIQLHGGHAYLATGYGGSGGGVAVLATATPLTPTLAGVLDLPDGAIALAIPGQTGYVADGRALSILDLAVPTNPGLRETLRRPALPQQVHVVGDRAYAVDRSQGVYVLDVSDATLPRPLGVYTDILAYDIDVAGSRAYIAGYRSLDIVAMSDPAAPIRLGRYTPAWDSPFFGGIRAVEVHGTLAYLAIDMASTATLQIVDISNPAVPTLVGSYSDTGAISGVQVVGSVAYLAFSKGVRLINVGQPGTPVELGRYEEMVIARDIAVNGPYAYVGVVTGSGGAVWVLDIQDAQHPTKHGMWTTDSPVRRIDRAGTMLAVASYAGGVQLLDVTLPATPVLRASHDGIGSTGVAIVGTTIYGADQEGGLFMVAAPQWKRTVFLPMLQR